VSVCSCVFMGGFLECIVRTMLTMRVFEGMFDIQAIEYLHVTLPSAKSKQVVNCFIGIIVFQLICENLLEYLEKEARGTVYAAVLHKTFVLKTTVDT